MALNLLSFNRDWKNPADFPTVEPDETTVRADLQYHPDAIKDYINETLVPSHDSLLYAKHSHANKSALDLISEDKVEKWDAMTGTFRINVSMVNGKLSADKTFAEIKTAYDAGMLPYVVDINSPNFATVYPLASPYLPAGGQMCMDFERCEISDEGCEARVLRIYSYVTDTGSNVVRRSYSASTGFVVTISGVGANSGVDRTNAQIRRAIKEGETIVLKVEEGDEAFVATGAFVDSNEDVYLFSSHISFQGFLNAIQVYVSHDDRVACDVVAGRYMYDYYSQENVDRKIAQCQPKTITLRCQYDSATDLAQMEDQDAYAKIQAARAAGCQVFVEIGPDTLPLVTAGTDYFSFSACTGFFSSPSHKDELTLHITMVTVFSDGTAHYLDHFVREI